MSVFPRIDSAGIVVKNATGIIKVKRTDRPWDKLPLDIFRLLIILAILP
jgi:hypothetical protein